MIFFCTRMANSDHELLVAICNDAAMVYCKKKLFNYNQSIEIYPIGYSVEYVASTFRCRTKTHLFRHAY